MDENQITKLLSIKNSINDKLRKVRELDNTMLRYISSRQVFCKKDVFRNFAKFTGQHLCQSLFFNKVAGPRPKFYTKKYAWKNTLGTVKHVVIIFKNIGCDT